MSDTKNEFNSVIVIIMLICTVLLLLAMANLPSGYYKMLRIIVFIGGGIGAINAAIRKEYIWAFLLAIPAIVFNPIVPIYLYDPQKWLPFDIGGALVFILRTISIISKKAMRLLSTILPVYYFFQKQYRLIAYWIFKTKLQVEYVLIEEAVLFEGIYCSVSYKAKGVFSINVNGQVKRRRSGTFYIKIEKDTKVQAEFIGRNEKASFDLTKDVHKLFLTHGFESSAHMPSIQNMAPLPVKAEIPTVSSGVRLQLAEIQQNLNLDIGVPVVNMTTTCVLPNINKIELEEFNQNNYTHET